MRELTADDQQARTLGLALLDASRIYEGFVIPTREGRFWRSRPFPPHRRAIIGLVGRQRRFLSAAYTLADAGLVLEALGPVRSMYEFRFCQRWLARDPERNWKLWMEADHKRRDYWRAQLQQNAPALHDAAVDALTPEQRREGEAVAVARARLSAEIGDPLPDDRFSIEQWATQVGMRFVYDTVYRYQSNVLHPSMFAVDLLLEPHPTGARLRGEPSSQFEAPSIYLDAALLLRDALQESGDMTPALSLNNLPAIGAQLHTLAERTTSARLSNWRDFLADVMS
jgi:hypothetical protein